MKGNGVLTQRLLSFWKGHRKFLVWGFVVVGVAWAGCWVVPPLVFQYRFGAILPAGVSRSTAVISMSWPAPTGVPKSYNRQVREFFGFYPSSYTNNVWWKQFPKPLDDVLAEYGARVEDGQLVDANGRNITFMKKRRGSSSLREWDDKRSKLVREDRTVLVVDIEEDE